jgi:hypothetical protein
MSDIYSRIARISRCNAFLRHYLAAFGIYPPPPPFKRQTASAALRLLNCFETSVLKRTLN